jgi:hypothetical protein
MLYHFIQGYVDAIYVAATLRPPALPQPTPQAQDADKRAPAQRARAFAPTAARLVAWCGALLGSLSWSAQASGPPADQGPADNEAASYLTAKSLRASNAACNTVETATCPSTVASSIVAPSTVAPSTVAPSTVALREASMDPEQGRT